MYYISIKLLLKEGGGEQETVWSACPLPAGFSLRENICRPIPVHISEHCEGVLGNLETYVNTETSACFWPGDTEWSRTRWMLEQLTLQ